MSSLTKEINTALTARVRESLDSSLRPPSVPTVPSPHFYQTGAFHPDLYSDIRSHLPTSNLYGGVHGRTGNVRAKKSRLALPLRKETLERLPDEIRSFWVSMTSYFMSAEFLRLALTAYLPLLSTQRPDLIGQDTFDIRFELLRDSTAYGIGPHADNPRKIMTLLFYLSAGETSEALGTSFYTPKQKGFTCQTGRHHTYEDFDLYKTYAYAPNAVLSFLRTDTSFHGVEVIEEQNVQRDVLRWMVWKP